MSLFAGIGGFDLGLERAGMRCLGQVEIDPFCQRVLAHHWPEVPRHDDVRTTVKWWGDRSAPLVVAGGFPCQPVSDAGLRRAQADPRWLWPPFCDVVRALRPEYVFMENVARLLQRGFGDVAADLAALGYDLEWDCLPAAAFGAPHPRDRLCAVAYLADRAESEQSQGAHPEALLGARTGASLRVVDGVAPTGVRGRERDAADGEAICPRIFVTEPRAKWSSEPDVARMVHGVPDRMDRRKALGNALVPAVAEYVGRLILADYERCANAA